MRCDSFCRTTVDPPCVDTNTATLTRQTLLSRDKYRGRSSPASPLWRVCSCALIDRPSTIIGGIIATIGRGLTRVPLQSLQSDSIAHPQLGSRRDWPRGFRAAGLPGRGASGPRLPGRGGTGRGASGPRGFRAAGLPGRGASGPRGFRAAEGLAAGLPGRGDWPRGLAAGTGRGDWPRGLAAGTGRGASGPRRDWPRGSRAAGLPGRYGTPFAPTPYANENGPEGESGPQDDVAVLREDSA